MKFINRLKNMWDNTSALLQAEERPMSKKDLTQLMVDQLGAGWIDRVFAVRGKLNPSTVDSIISGASSRKFGDIGKLYELFYYIRNDARIGGMVDKRVSAVSRAMWDVEPGNKDNSTSVDASQFLNKYLNDIRLKSFLEQGMDGKLYGVTAFHNIILDVGSHYVFKDPSENQISQSRWYQERSNDQDWGKLYMKSREGKKLFLHKEEDIHPAQISPFIYKYKKGYYDTTGIMARVTRLYVAKIWTIVFLSQLVERHGKPFIYAMLNDKNFNDPDFKGKVTSVLKQFGAERWGVFPDGFNIESLDSHSPGATDMHIKFLDFINVETAIAILGQNLSTEVQGGSFAAASSHADVEDDLVETDVEWLQEQMNDGFIYWLIRINYPELIVDDYPKIRLTAKKNIDVEKVARSFKAASELVDVPVSEIYSETQIRPPRKKENAPEDATGSELYDEEVVGPSTRRRARRLDEFVNGI